MALCSVTNRILNVSGGVVRALANLGRLELLIAGVACMTALAGADTIADGNFSSVTGFGSDYTNAGSTCSPGSVGAGKYFIGSIPTACNPLWESISPYNGESNMMIVNGGGDETSRVWYETLSTTPNTQYTFTFWVADLDTHRSICRPRHSNSQSILWSSRAAVTTHPTRPAFGCRKHAPIPQERAQAKRWRFSTQTLRGIPTISRWMTSPIPILPTVRLERAQCRSLTA